MNVRDSVSQNEGAVAIVAALSLVAFLGFAALVIDFGFGLVTRNQLQNIADGASLAGTRQLGRVYEGLTTAEQDGYVLTEGDKSVILAKVREIGEKNAAGGKTISINTEDVVIGRWDITQKSLIPTDVNPDAVRVVARRDDQANSPLTTFFAGTMGTDKLNVAAQATAALTGINKVTEGELDAPLGIARVWFDGNFCDLSIQFSPSNNTDGCAGWHTFFDAPNANNLRGILRGLRNGTFISPEAAAGATQFNFIGGDMSSVSAEFQALYEAKAVCSTTGALCSAEACYGTCEWSTFVGVYDFASCSNPNTRLTIVGFATMVIYQVAPPPDRTIRARVECDAVQANARGGGVDLGTKGSIPGLVQ
jgi:Flp pilus assembly protein TadG